jgi:hypothetical protein
MLFPLIRDYATMVPTGFVFESRNALCGSVIEGRFATARKAGGIAEKPGCFFRQKGKSFLEYPLDAKHSLTL